MTPLPQNREMDGCVPRISWGKKKPTPLIGKTWRNAIQCWGSMGATLAVRYHPPPQLSAAPCRLTRSLWFFGTVIQEPAPTPSACDVAAIGTEPASGWLLPPTLHQHYPPLDSSWPTYKNHIQARSYTASCADMVDVTLHCDNRHRWFTARCSCHKLGAHVSTYYSVFSSLLSLQVKQPAEPPPKRP